MAMIQKLYVLSKHMSKSPILSIMRNYAFNRTKTIYCVQNKFQIRTCTTQPICKEQEVKVIFVKASGERIEANGKVGDTLLDIVINNDIDLDGFGACQGTVTCSTCHLIIPKDVYDNLPEKPSTDEIDMLDLVHELTDTSRLGCQITMTKDLDGLEVFVPASINDARSVE